MTAIDASAPGKAVLCGEYAVLDGAPAIAMAVDRRARVRITASGEAFYTVTAPGLYEGAVAFRVAENGSIEWRDGAAGARFALFEHVWRTVAPARRRCLDLVLDTRSFFREPGGRKLGLGSSAALVTALAAALAGAEAALDDLHRTAAAAHRTAQDGKGSGVDVAAAVHGGVIGYRMEPLSIEKLDWPAGLHFELLWSGRPASTSDKLARLAAARRAASATGLGDAAAAVLASWREEAPRAILEGVRAYTAALQRFSADHDLGVFDGGHQALVDEAHGRGLVYKPCGAGGGDIGIVFAEERAAAADFAAGARSRGFEPLQVSRDPRGVQRAGRLAP
jgi:phosphomevalonate kinase